MGFALRIEEQPRYTDEDYATWDEDWELIDGVAWAMSPSPTFAHQRISQVLAELLGDALKSCPHCLPVFDFDWKIDKATIVRPDNMVVCHVPENQNHLTRAPALIFEILSPSTARKDAGVKFRLYEAEGVMWYALVDPDERVLKIYRLSEGRYIKQADLTRESFEFDLGACRFVLDFSRLWGR